MVYIFTLAVYKFGRTHFCYSFKGDGANHSKYPSRKKLILDLKFILSLYLTALSLYFIINSNLMPKEFLPKLLWALYTISSKVLFINFAYKQTVLLISNLKIVWNIFFFEWYNRNSIKYKEDGEWHWMNN